jgi:hypothetical protein
MNWDPDLIVIGTTLVTGLIGFPLAKALARRLEHRDESVKTPEVLQRLRSIEQAVDAIAVEVERISEAQRFTARVLAERAEPVKGSFPPAS